MLKGIPSILSPQLLKVLCEMGHSDTLVIADGNFPSESIGRGGIVIRMDGHSAPEVLEAVLELFPLDSYISQPVSLMEVMSGDTVETPIWDTYEEIVKRCSGLEGSAIGHIEPVSYTHLTLPTIA